MNVTTLLNSNTATVEKEYQLTEIEKPAQSDKKTSAPAHNPIQYADSFGSVPTFECYNNYTKSGKNYYALQTQQPDHSEQTPANIEAASSATMTKAQPNSATAPMLSIDLRPQGQPHMSWKNRILNSLPQDRSNEWETLRVFYDEDGVTTRAHKRPPEDLRVVLITNGPLGVRYELEILSVSHNSSGMQTGFTVRPVDLAKRTADSRLLSSEMRRIEAIAAQGVQDFIDGKIDAAEISKIIETIYNELVSLSIALGNTDGNDPKINAEILTTAQRMFSDHALDGTINANEEQGRAIAQERNILCPWGQQRWVHYNAKFLFMNQELQEIGRSAIAQIAQNEGLDFFAVNAVPKRCFNEMWRMIANNRGVATMRDLNLEPPRDFSMFFTADRFGSEARNNGTRQIIFASDPTRTDGHGSHTFHIWVPRGASLFSSMPLWLTQGTHVSGDGESFVAWDVTRHLNFKAGDDLNSRLREFFAKHVNNFDKGELLIWSGGEKSVHDVPFCIFFDNRRGFQGSELTSAVKHSAFINNFEFHIYNRRW